MSKYEKLNFNNQSLNIDNILTPGESILWKGKPKKSAFIINKSIVMLPFALLWLSFDIFFIINFVFWGQFENILIFIIPFFAFHLMPVWIWLANVLTANRRWKNTKYIVTDKRIIIQSGFIGTDYKTLYYKDISNVHLNIGVIDTFLKVGDIYFDTTKTSQSNTNIAANTQAFLDIEDAYELYQKLQKVVLDIQTDIEYPNDLRPETNKGYNTKYDGNF